MAANLQLWAIGVTAANAILSAGVGLTAIYMAHRFAEARERRKDAVAAENRRRDVIREKLESMVEAVEESYEMLWQRCDVVAAAGLTVANGGRDFEMFPLSSGLPARERANMLQALYFPDLAPRFAAIAQRTAAVHGFIGQEIAVWSVDGPRWLAEHQPTFVARQAAILTPLRTEVFELTIDVRHRIEQLMPT